MQKRLVSLITPTFNNGALIPRLLNSILQQTYPYIEHIVIDDGSTDNTKEVIQKYVPLYKEKGYNLVYQYQKNSGQSTAIKNGLKLIKGEFLAWPDSDDFYSSIEAIDKMVQSLMTLPPEYAIVRSCQRIVEENTLREIKIQGMEHDNNHANLFEDCLYGKNGFYWGAGAYMLRISDLEKSTTFDIYTHKDAGQNWQLFLPIFYSYICYTIKEVLYTVVERANSHGRGAYKGYNQLILRKQVYEQTLLNTLDRIKAMPHNEVELYKKHIRTQLCLERMELAYQCRERFDYNKDYQWLRNNNKKAINRINRIRWYVIKTKTEKFLDLLIKLYHKIKQ